MPASSVYDLAAELLAAANTALATTAEGAITRAFVSPGIPALDCCPQLTVHATQIGEAGQLGQSPLGGGHHPQTQWVPLIGLMVTVVRCSPTTTDGGKVPTATALDDAAARVDADAWAIWNEFWARFRDGTLMVGTCKVKYIDPALPLTPQGGCAGWTIPVRVEQDAYDPEAP